MGVCPSTPLAAWTTSNFQLVFGRCNLQLATVGFILDAQKRKPKTPTALLAVHILLSCSEQYIRDQRRTKMSNFSKKGGNPKRESILELSKLMDAQVRVKCLGGRELKGTLRGYDELVNLVLDECDEFIRGKLRNHLCCCLACVSTSSSDEYLPSRSSRP